MITAPPVASYVEKLITDAMAPLVGLLATDRLTSIRAQLYAELTMDPLLRRIIALIGASLLDASHTSGLTRVRPFPPRSSFKSSPP
jgi:hypothetical protein